MDRYTICCTQWQVMKAFELGANVIKVIDDFNAVPTCYIGNDLYEIPTAEQMIGWLEKEYIYKITIDAVNRKGWFFIVDIDENSSTSNDNLYPSRKEATIAAIDTALEYLTNKKE